ncbi:hypothetical protein QJS10_CPB20g00001 [Acorus calamus]|uniref:Uncharacterized protein n=1 Tax=Acorus calamus TaxID=4465 RepID=A0AAV9CB25_ACOCL|nr:hypothetical protein QJS10_CPB20g00001 [Acorus calamus]
MASDEMFNEAEPFKEYNPTPYKGGYDIALTYGNPLPPSSTTCYPLSDSHTTTSSTAPPIAAPPRNEEETPSSNQPYNPEHDHDHDHGFFSFGYDGDSGEQHDNYQGVSIPEQPLPWDYPHSGYYDGPPDHSQFCSDVFGYWPCLSRRDWENHGHHGGEHGGYGDNDTRRHPWEDTVEYLFGYPQPQGYGALRTEDYPLHTYTFAYERHSPQQPLHVVHDPYDKHTSWSQETSYAYDRPSEDWMPPSHLPSRHVDESNKENGGHDYHPFFKYTHYDE